MTYRYTGPTALIAAGALGAFATGLSVTAETLCPLPQAQSFCTVGPVDLPHTHDREVPTQFPSIMDVASASTTSTSMTSSTVAGSGLVI